MHPAAVAGPICAYLLGSIPTGVLFARVRGVDLQKTGSGNIGATNAARTLGKKVGAVVLLCDALKGFAPVFVAARWLPVPPLVVALMGLLAILGHVFPVWLRFHGGKGVATAFGVFLAIAPLAAAVALVTYVLAYLLFRISSVGSLAGATAFVVALVLMRPNDAYLLLGGAAWLVIVISHRGNIRRLLRREESKI
jgi:acyl phosphate:glycerol-3-phosphate acyltransferase